MIRESLRTLYLSLHSRHYDKATSLLEHFLLLMFYISQWSTRSRAANEVAQVQCSAVERLLDRIVNLIVREVRLHKKTNSHMAIQYTQI